MKRAHPLKRLLRSAAIGGLGLAMFCLAGGHWGLLQAVAWAGMVRTYSQESGLVRGVMRTFDGQNPCGLCERIQEQSAPDTQTPFVMASTLKFEAVASAAPAGSGGPCSEAFSYPWPSDQDAARHNNVPDPPVPKPA